MFQHCRFSLQRDHALSVHGRLGLWDILAAPGVGIDCHRGGVSRSEDAADPHDSCAYREDKENDRGVVSPRLLGPRGGNAERTTQQDDDGNKAEHGSVFLHELRLQETSVFRIGIEDSALKCTGRTLTVDMPEVRRRIEVVRILRGRVSRVHRM